MSEKRKYETRNEALDKSEIVKNESEARHFKADAEHKELLCKGLHFSYLQAKRKSEIEEADDFNSGYFRWVDPINGSSSEVWLAMLRCFCRVHANEKKKPPITIELNSPGGNIIEGFQIFDEIERLKKEGYHFTVRVRGIAASMAAVLFQAADVREIGQNAHIMIHRASFGIAGKAYEVEDEVEFTKKLEGNIADIFSKRSGKKRKVFDDLFAKRKDLYFNSEECIEFGLADEIA